MIWTCVKKATRSKFSPVKRYKGRPKRTLEKIIKKDLMGNNIFENLVYYQTQLYCMIHVADPPSESVSL